MASYTTILFLFGMGAATLVAIGMAALAIPYVRRANRELTASQAAKETLDDTPSPTVRQYGDVDNDGTCPGPDTDLPYLAWHPTLPGADDLWWQTAAEENLLTTATSGVMARGGRWTAKLMAAWAAAKGLTVPLSEAPLSSGECVSVLSGGFVSPHSADDSVGEVAFVGSSCFASCFALAGFAGEVGGCLGLLSGLADRGDVKHAVDAPVASEVEPVLDRVC